MLHMTTTLQKCNASVLRCCSGLRGYITHCLNQLIRGYVSQMDPPENETLCKGGGLNSQLTEQNLHRDATTFNKNVQSHGRASRARADRLHSSAPQCLFKASINSQSYKFSHFRLTGGSAGSLRGGSSRQLAGCHLFNRKYRIR